MKLEISDKGELNLKTKQFGITGWNLMIEAEDEYLSSCDAKIEIQDSNPLTFTLTFPKCGVIWHINSKIIENENRLILDSKIENTSSKPVKLGKAYLFSSNDSIKLGESGDDVLCLSLDGIVIDRNVYPLSSPDSVKTSRIKTQFYNRKEKTAFQIGFVTYKKADTLITFTSDSSGSIQKLQAYCDFSGLELQPDQTTVLESLTIACGDNPYTQLENWADIAAKKNGALKWNGTPIGWVGWAWVDGFSMERYEDVALRNASAIRQRLPGFDIDYVWISIGNLAGNNPGDWLNWNYEMFPSGPEQFSKKLADLDFKFGLWCGPFWVCSLLTDFIEEYKDALLKNHDGSLLEVSDFWSYGEGAKFPPDQRPVMYGLDPSHPKTLSYLKKVFETYREWGVRYYMIDFLEAGSGTLGRVPYAGHYDKNLVAGPEAYHTALNIIREAAGEDTYLLSSTGPTVHNTGAAHAVRVGCDFGEGRPIIEGVGHYPATFGLNSVKTETGALRALRNQASAFYTHRKLYINDSGNVLTVDKPLPLSDAQINATIHALSGGPSMFGDDIGYIDEERLALIKKTLPRSPQLAKPIDLFDSVYPDHPKLFHRKITEPWGSYDVLAVYNLTKESLDIDLDLAKLELNSDSTYLVWEFWDLRYVGQVSKRLNVSIPPGTVRVYRFTENIGQPTILATDMHVLMGEMEIDNCVWNSSNLTLSITAHRPAGESGSIYIHAPTGLAVDNQKAIFIAKDLRDKTLIIRVPVTFEKCSNTINLRFRRI